MFIKACFQISQGENFSFCKNVIVWDLRNWHLYIFPTKVISDTHLFLRFKKQDKSLHHNLQSYFLHYWNLFHNFVPFIGTIHFSLRAFSNIILYWNLDNFDLWMMSNERPRLWYLYTLNRAYYIIWRGLCLLYKSGSPEPQ